MERLDWRPMASVEVQGVEGMQALVGQEIGPSEWRTVTQEDIDTFARLSGDDQWIHVDVERAKAESPFGTTIAHGNLTLSLVDGFRKELISSSGFALGVNYGWNKIRFPAPVPVDSRSAAAPRSSRSTRSAAAGGRSSPASPSRSRATRSPASSATA